jgi:general secretion pathway protein D
MRKPALTLQTQALIAGIACTLAMPALAGPSSYSGSSSIVEQEMIKRQEDIRQALEAEREGDRRFAKQDYSGALERYQFALNILPNGLSTQADRKRIVGKFAKAAVIHARELGHRGEFDKAKSLLNGVLSENMDPNYEPAERLLKQLDDPDRFNQAMTPKHYANTEEVKRLFTKGLGYYELGQFAEAQTEFNRVLAIDPTNTAARRNLERTERELTNYYKAARDHTRLKMLNEVDNLWVTAVPGTARTPLTPGDNPSEDPGSASLTYKLNNIIIDRITLSESDISEVVQFLKKESIKADTIETDPNKKGVDFIVRGTEGAKAVTLELRSVKLMDAIRSVCEVAGVRFDVQPNAVVIFPLTGGSNSMTTRQFRVPPDFLSRGADSGGGGGAAAPADPFASGGTEASSGPALPTRKSARSVLESLGVTFGEGSSASYDPTTGRLIVKNSFDQLDLVDTLIEGMINNAPKQVFITTKFVEVTQRNNEELGFDWLVGAFNIGGERVFGAGGTSGNAGPLDPADYSIVSPGGTPVGGSPITRGLRFGNNAISRNAIDALIAGGAQAGVSGVTPGVFAISGVFTDPQFQVMMRALSQKKGVDLMTAPSIIVRTGQRSKIEVIREFPWPTEFDPPQIPQTFGGGGGIGGGLGGLGGSQQGSSFPVTPTTPNAFQFRNTGVTMEVEATVGEDGYTIDLNVAPEVVEFEGFINYGSPIQTTGINALGQSEPVVLTENKILQPVFATRKLQTQVLIWDRQTVGIGGLIREDVQSVEDKVPIISSIPVLGRLFKTKNEEHFKKNLMIYVTGQLVDPAGQPIHDNKAPELDTTATGPESILLPETPPPGGVPVISSGK